MAAGLAGLGGRFIFALGGSVSDAQYAAGRDRFDHLGCCWFRRTGTDDALLVLGSCFLHRRTGLLLWQASSTFKFWAQLPSSFLMAVCWGFARGIAGTENWLCLAPHLRYRAFEFGDVLTQFARNARAQVASGLCEASLAPCVLIKEATADVEILVIAGWQDGPFVFGKPLRESHHSAGRRCWPV
jgi:hypothetical protein